MSVRLRRARCVTCYWHDGAFVVHPYAHGSPVALQAGAAEIMSVFDEWTTPDDGVKALRALMVDNAEQAVEALLECGLLLAEGSPEAGHDERLHREWRSWAPEAAFFHHATQDVTYDDDPVGVRGLVETGRPPLFGVRSEAERVLLPRAPASLAVPYGEVLYGRRTHRDYAQEPVPLGVFATLLAAVFGPVDYIDADMFGALVRRTSAAGGARQEIDAYLGVRAVVGVEPGVYHYNALEHSLELLSAGFTADEAVHLCADQEWAGEAAFVVVLTAVIDRMRSKYRTPRAYRVVLLDAGHLGQTFAMTATALGLGAAQTGAFRDADVCERFDLDNEGHTPVYIVAAGIPAETPRVAPGPAGLAAFRLSPVTGGGG